MTYIKIRLQGFTLEGEIISAYNYGTADKPDWYVEFTDPVHGYVYWKQSYDGGELIEIK
jgi:hypothetical protein